MHLLDIPNKHVAALASILQFRPDESAAVRSKRISKDAKALPSLLRPSRLERMLLPPLGHLCKIHKNLDFSAVQVVLQHMQLEVGERLNNLVWKGELLDREQLSRVTRLRSLHALWLPPAEYEMTFLASTRDLRWRYQQDQCEACIVSHITSDLEVLLDLRCAVRSRATSKLLAKHGDPRLLVWVHAWVDILVQHLMDKTGQKIDVDVLIAQNEVEALRLMRRRTKIHALRKKTFKKLAKADPKGGVDGEKNIRQRGVDVDAGDEDEEEDDMDDADQAELDIINAYASLRSKSILSVLPNRHSLSQPEDITVTASHSHSHSISADPATKGASPYPQPRRQLAQESFYSIDTIVNGNVNAPAPAVTSDGLGGTDEVSAHGLRPAEDVYVPPRQAWKRPQPQTQSTASRTKKFPQPSMLPAGSRESWEIMPPMESSSTVFPSTATSHPPTKPRGKQSHQDPGVSTYQLPRHSISASIPRHRDGQKQPCPADTYVNLLDPTPFQAGQPLKMNQTSNRPYGGLDLCNSIYGSESDMYTVQTPIPDSCARPSPNPTNLADETKVEAVPIYKAPNASVSSTTVSTIWGGMYASGMVYREDLGWFYVEGK
ncbi:hypothetical protein A1O1_07130 [Capronia coronata CBS 617.96]|uniref:Uncharacterized protein n=1 Tax=Capronia coronata CBS 617.96 TaxID=1182541 RepID=W9XSI2_9EURO|nr:uncharacterized protein A1O1_07130 [Capronia coronata CBS 617.96]EXJ83507.1 hypothetical protein A1O1_07130 [Capronia coronata CBS 617.96]